MLNQSKTPSKKFLSTHDTRFNRYSFSSFEHATSFLTSCKKHGYAFAYVNLFLEAFVTLAVVQNCIELSRYHSFHNTVEAAYYDHFGSRAF
jgi:hypothetical protein